MSACCESRTVAKGSTPAPVYRELAAWVLPSTLLVLMPKCPMCLAAYIAVWTRVGLSLDSATYLQMVLFALCVAALFGLAVPRFSVVRPFLVSGSERT